MDRIKGGYILQPRCYDQSEAAHFPPCTREVWFYLLRNVNHADNGKYKRGGGFFALEDIQSSLSWTVGYRIERYSKPQLTKALRRLREGSMIATTKATRGLYITILNYDKYQDPSMYEGNDEGNAKETRRKREGMHLEQEWKNERMKEEKPSPKNGKEINFDSFWKAYPKKVAKVSAQKAWKNMKCDTLVDQILTAVEKAKASPNWTKEGGKFIPNPATWINGGRWDDEIDTTIEPNGAEKCKTCSYEKSIGCVDRDQTRRETCTSWQQA